MKLLLLVLMVLAPVASWARDAVVKIPVASVYGKPATTAERVTQVPMGDRVHVVRTSGDWVQVQVTDQYRLAEGYPGWMQKSQLGDGSASASDVTTVIVPKAALRSAPGGTVLNHVCMGTRLHLTGKPGGNWLEVAVPGTAHAGWVASKDVSAAPLPADGEDVVRTAETFIHTHYLWGGISLDGIDCSGLTFIAYRIHGITLPRDADQQFEMGTAVSRDQLQAGDLVFYGKSPDHITHVALYAEHGEIVEASMKGGVRRSTLTHRNDYQGARRVLGVPLEMPAPSP